jgi:hypothetical protein
MGGSRKALIVANFDYQEAALRRLSAPLQDAEALASVLGDGVVGGFEVTSLLNQSSSLVSQAIEEFFRFSNPKPDDLLLFYFSGHGITDEDGRLYFATADTRLAGQNVRGATAVAAEFVNDVMRRSRSRRQVLLLDCCYSGAFAEAMRAKGGDQVGAARHFQGEGRMVLAATGARQLALEGQNDPGTTMQSVYTRILVEGLRTGEADRDGDGLVNLDELHDYLLSRVPVESPGQTPSKSGYVEGQLYIAYTPILRPAPLPQELQHAIQNPLPLIREAAVQALANLLRGSHRGLALAANQALVFLKDEDDSLSVRRAAERCLIGYGGEKITTQRAEAEVPERKLPETARPTPDPPTPATIASAEREHLEGERREREYRERAKTEKAALDRSEAERRQRAREESDRLTRERATAAEGETLAREAREKQTRERAQRELPFKIMDFLRLGIEKAQGKRLAAAESSESRFGELKRKLTFYWFVFFAIMWLLAGLMTMADTNNPAPPQVAIPMTLGGAGVFLWLAYRKRRKK